MGDASTVGIQALLADLPRASLPRHVAIIMDGNGRWAKERGLPRAAGHRQGVETVRMVVTECARLGLEALTLYSFSSENWKRPADEVGALMALCCEFLRLERPTMLRENIRFRHIGRREGLPAEVLAELDETTAATAPMTGMTLCLALNYGSRTEIADAARALAFEVAAGRLDPAAIDERAVASHLSTAGLPDPDLLVRTAGEMRISNYLLWQISYAELHVTEVLWPDFDARNLAGALRDFARRERRFGDVLSAPSPGGA
ncbi:MAG: isoprenyl transferase [Planctomycetaceae bacterium]|nr:isoprenyl transferase [Planctomycetaceae bacterium]